MRINIPRIPMPKKQQPKETISMRDAGVIGAFLGAIAVLLLVAGYVIARTASERTYREKWKDYNDCGWA